MLHHDCVTLQWHLIEINHIYSDTIGVLHHILVGIYIIF
jgi:hypothetical protein